MARVRLPPGLSYAGVAFLQTILRTRKTAPRHLRSAHLRLPFSRWMTRCAEGCWELRDAPSNDRNASSDIVTSHRLLVVTLPKSTEGWTFQSPYDTIWWDTVFAGLSVSLSLCLPVYLPSLNPQD